MKNWTTNAMDILQKAQAKAYEYPHSQLEPLHLLWALLSETGLATNVLRSMELDPGLIARTAAGELDSLPTASVKDVPAPSRELQKVFLEAENLADGMIGTREILLALATDSGRAGSVLKTFDATRPKIERALEHMGAAQAGSSPPASVPMVIHGCCNWSLTFASSIMK